MKVSNPELFGVVAIVLYIVFFSHSPPVALRTALGNTYVAVALLAALSYITFYKSLTLGVLLILAFLLTMTRVTEHLDASATSSSPDGGVNAKSGPPTNIPLPPMPPTPGASSSAPILPATSVVSSEPPASNVSANAKTSSAPAQTPPPTIAPVSTPPAPVVPPTPVMSCNIESFAPF